jgi:DNA mismatch repair protein MutS
VIRHATRELERLEAQGAPTPQLGLFGESTTIDSAAQTTAEQAAALDGLREAINELDPDTLSPREALDALYRLKTFLH